MSSLPLEDKRNRLIIALYELRAEKGEHVKTEELRKRADVGTDFYPLLRELGVHGRGWLEHRNLVVRIRPAGTERAEELTKMQMAEKERRVLQKIYDLGGPTHTDMVPFDTLERALGMEFDELNKILLDFERRRGWVEGPDEAVELTPAGVREVENPSSEARAGVTTIQNVFHGPVQGGFMQGGIGNVQHNAYANNPNVDEMIGALTKLIQEAQIEAADKEEILADIERLKQLASKPQTADSLKRISRRIDMIKTGISAAETVEKGGKLLLKATPYLSALWQILTS